MSGRTLGEQQADGTVLFSTYWPRHTAAQRRRILASERDEPCERCRGTGDGIGWNEWVCRDCHGTGEALP